MNTYNGIITYNGWIDLNMDADDDSHDHSDLMAVIESMKPLIEEFNSIRTRFVEHIQLNFTNTYYIGGAHNHMGSYLDELLTLYRKIGEVAKGSFGLIYVRLDEHEEQWHQYRIFRMAKGVVTEHEDTLLSPCVPIIESPND